MTIFVPLMLFGWVPLTVFFFIILKPHHAVLVSVIGGTLLLPMASYDFQGIPDFSKDTSIAFGLILGIFISGPSKRGSFQWRIYDLPMIFWCLCPIATSHTNELGLYDGLSSSFQQIMQWGIPYLAGRIYFNSIDTLRDLCLGIIIGGLLYVPLCLYEIRMSPQLSNIFYGFFPHSFAQHFRYGGFRPIVFMQHGLMVSLWMAISSMVAFWAWRNGVIKHLKGMPISFAVLALVMTCMLCKSANGWFALFVGCGSCVIYRYFKTRIFLLLLLLTIPFYLGFRLTNIIPTHEILTMASYLFDPERISSLEIRLIQEELFLQRVFERILFGWGGYDRGIPIDPFTGKRLISFVDSLWVIAISSRGFFGLFSLNAAMLIGPWLVLRRPLERVEKMEQLSFYPTVLSLVVILFMIDSLFNGMVNPSYILCSGALVGFYHSIGKS